MSYGLGIDLGTSHTVAAISRSGAESTGPELVALGAGTVGIPTVLHLADDGTMLVGAAAEPLVLSDPDRVFRGFLHHVGEESSGADAEPSPAELTARLVRWVVETVARREGGPAGRITLAHPAAWGPRECRALQTALTECGLSGVVLVPAPLVAAEACAAQWDVPPGTTLAVYDLGTTFSASVVRRDGAGFVLLGEPRVLADGGGRFDELVLARVLDELGDRLGTPDLDDPAVLAGMAQLLADCVTARETLGDRPEATIPVSLPELRTEVRLTRDELDLLVDPPLRATVTTLRAAIVTSRLKPAEVDAVLVTGGCARMPQVARLLSAELGRPLVVLNDPELATAHGAALLAAEPPPTSLFPAPSQVAAQPPADHVEDPGTRSPAPSWIPAAAPTMAAASLSAGSAPADIPQDRFPADLPQDRFPATSDDQPAARPPRRLRGHTLLALAAGMVAVTAITLPLTMFRAPDLGPEQPASRVTHGEPGRSGRAPAYGGAVASLAPAETSSAETTARPAAPSRPPAVPRSRATPPPAAPAPPATRPTGAVTGTSGPSPTPTSPATPPGTTTVPPSPPPSTEPGAPPSQPPSTEPEPTPPPSDTSTAPPGPSTPPTSASAEPAPPPPPTAVET